LGCSTSCQSKVTGLCSSSNKKFTAERWSAVVGSASQPEAVVNATKLLLANEDKTLRIPTSEWRTTLQNLRSDGACCYQVLRLALSVPSLSNDIDEGCLHIVAISCIQSARAATDNDEARRLFENALEVISIMRGKRFTQGTTTAFRAIIHAASVAQCPEVVDRALSMQSEAICAGVLSKYVGVMPKSPTPNQPPSKSGDLSQPKLFLDLEQNTMEQLLHTMDPTTTTSINAMPPASPYVKSQKVMPPQDKTSAPQQGHKYHPPAAFTFIQADDSDAFSDTFSDEEEEETRELKLTGISFKPSSDDESLKDSDNDYSEELSSVMPWRVSSDDDYSSDDSPLVV